MHFARPLLVFGLAALATGCDREPPAGPSGAAPLTVTGLTVTGPEAVLTGVSTPFLATATFSDGRTQTGTTVWTSSNPAVATVDAGGQVVGLAHGSTTLTATYVGRTVSKTVQVVNNYGGSWVGKYVVNACDGFPGWCEDTLWAAFSISLEILQAGRDQSEISASFGLPSVFPVEMRATIGGRVTPDGRLNLGGTSDLTDRRGVWATFQVGGSDMSLSSPNAMRGRWEHSLSGVPTSRPPFSGYQQNELLTMTRVTSSVLPTSAIH